MLYQRRAVALNLRRAHVGAVRHLNARQLARAGIGLLRSALLLALAGAFVRSRLFLARYPFFRGGYHASYRVSLHLSPSPSASYGPQTSPEATGADESPGLGMDGPPPPERRP